MRLRMIHKDGARKMAAAAGDCTRIRDTRYVTSCTAIFAIQDKLRAHALRRISKKITYLPT